MILELILLLVYKLLLDFSYLHYASELYQYQGFIQDFNQVKFFESTIILIVVYLLYVYKNRVTNITNLILIILITLVIVPTCVLYGMENSNRAFFYFIIIGFISTCFISKLPLINIKHIIVKEKNLLFLLVMFSLFIIGLLIFFEGAPNIRAFNFTNVYEIRRSASLPRFLSYLMNWQTKIISLFLLGYSLFYKKKLLFVVSIIIQLLIYSITAHKMILFSPLLLIGIFLIIKYSKRVNLIFILGINLMVFLSFIIFKVGLSEWPASLFIRRMILVPVKNANYVFDFFYEIEKIKLSNSIFRGIFSYPYDKGTYYLIGERYYNNPLTNANANYLADAYLHFGLIGILLFSILLGILLWILKNISYGKPLIITVGAVLIGLYSLVDSALLTSLLTNGILLGMMLIFFTKKTNNT